METLRDSREKQDRRTPLTKGSGFTWKPRGIIRSWAPGDLERQIAEASPTNADLLDRASRQQNRPPQRWWDEASDPLSPQSER